MSGTKSTNAVQELHIKEILAPVDFSDRSLHALDFAKGLAERFNARLTLLNVVDLNPMGWEVGAIDLAMLEKDLMEGAKKRLDSLVSERLVGIRAAAPIQRVGPPALEIVEAARELESDLIVISTHGYTGLKHVLMGSVAEQINRHAPCPTLIIPPHKKD